MAEFEFELYGTQAMDRFISRQAQQFEALLVEKSARAAVDWAARRGVDIILSKLNQPARGETYDIAFRTLVDSAGRFYVAPLHGVTQDRGPLPHQASAPFDPPRTWSGELEGGVGWERIQGAPPGAAARVYIKGDEEKLESLEYGAPGHHSSGGLEPRPFVRASREQLGREIPVLYRNHIRSEVKRGVKAYRRWVRNIFAKKRQK